ncbi:MAG: prolyl oligopeptidase family serine peptidase [Phycisphaerae bacterium]|nr:prolyl oligopeptidase family serine peptidase [Phycisphaerae bacterium]
MSPDRLRIRRGVAGALTLLFVTVTVAAASPVSQLSSSGGPIWDMAALRRPPAVRQAEGFAEPGLRAVYYEGLPWKGNTTRAFAWIGLPPNAAQYPAPGIVLVHGGGGTAFAEWVRLWVDRGYAAIAMDTCGCTPRGSYGNWQRHEHGGPPGWGGFDQVDEPTGDQWTFQAIANVVLAHSLLASLPEVDANRIGITGISWGGYLTCIAAGVDDRFKFAVPVYGCGFLGENSTWLGTFERMGDKKSTKWLQLWDPSVYLSQARMPMLWVTGTNDFAYPMDSLQKSYRLPKGPRTLSVRVRMAHAHGGPGENPEEIRALADSITGRATALPAFGNQGVTEAAAWAHFKSAQTIDRAELNYTTDSGPWKERRWQSVSARIDLAAERVEADLPAGTAVYYFNLISKDGLVVSSEHVTLPPQRTSP